MTKTLVMFVLAGMMSAPGVAQTAPATNPSTTVNQIQPAKPQVVKKRVCQMVEDEDPYSRLGTRKICHTIEVKEPVQVPADGQQPSATERDSTSGR